MKNKNNNPIERAAIEAEVKFMQECRINFSKQADEVIEKIKRGEKSTDADYFILLHTDQDKIDEAIELQSIKDRMAKGRITHEDVDFLVNMLGDVGEIDKALRNALYIKGDQINYTYAQSHPEEFTQDEINEMQQKVIKSKTIKESIKDDLRCL